MDIDSSSFDDISFIDIWLPIGPHWAFGFAPAEDDASDTSSSLSDGVSDDSQDEAPYLEPQRQHYLLPFDIFDSIMRFIPPVPMLVDMRRVCRAWRAAFENIIFTRIRSLDLIENFSNPYEELIYRHMNFHPLRQSYVGDFEEDEDDYAKQNKRILVAAVCIGKLFPSLTHIDICLQTIFNQKYENLLECFPRIKTMRIFVGHHGALPPKGIAQKLDCLEIISCCNWEGTSFKKNTQELFGVQSCHLKFFPRKWLGKIPKADGQTRFEPRTSSEVMAMIDHLLTHEKLTVKQVSEMLDSYLFDLLESNDTKLCIERGIDVSWRSLKRAIPLLDRQWVEQNWDKITQPHRSFEHALILGMLSSDVYEATNSQPTDSQRELAVFLAKCYLNHHSTFFPQIFHKSVQDLYRFILKFERFGVKTTSLFRESIINDLCDLIDEFEELEYKKRFASHTWMLIRYGDFKVTSLKQLFLIMAFLDFDHVCRGIAQEQWTRSSLLAIFWSNRNRTIYIENTLKELLAQELKAAFGLIEEANVEESSWIGVAKQTSIVMDSDPSSEYSYEYQLLECARQHAHQEIFAALCREICARHFGENELHQFFLHEFGINAVSVENPYVLRMILESLNDQDVINKYVNRISLGSKTSPLKYHILHGQLETARVLYVFGANDERSIRSFIFGYIDPKSFKFMYRLLKPKNGTTIAEIPCLPMQWIEDSKLKALFATRKKRPLESEEEDDDEHDSSSSEEVVSNEEEEDQS